MKKTNIIRTKGRSIHVDHVTQLPQGDVGLQNSIVRLNNRHIDAKKQDCSRFFRRDAVVIINTENNEKGLRQLKLQ